ncbi:MAG: helix-hairpin-helix domain-containing protein [Haloplanus sp.]
MGLLDTLLSLLGLGDSSSDDERRETTVSVEREARTDTEAAVKGTDEAVAAGTDASASTDALVDEADETTDAAEPAEAAGPVAEDGETELDTAASESKGETTGEHEAVEIEDAEESTEPASVEVIKGIGPAYAERLANAGVHSVADLAAADAAELAPKIDLSEKRVGRWIERAQDH